MKWHTISPGIRARDHATRRHGVKPDRYFTIRLYVNGRRIEEALGWASEGWTLGKAQAELTRLKEAKRTGIGPATLREKREIKRRADEQRDEADVREARLARTVADLWERYSKEVVAVGNKPRTAAEKSRMWKGRIEPAIGALKLKDVTEEDAGAVVRAPLRLDESGHVTGGKAEAANLYRLLHHMMRQALKWGLRPRDLGNPLENIAQPKVERRHRLLTGSEVGSLLKALDAARADGSEHPTIIAVARAAILTGARITELLTLEWDHIRRDESELHLPDTKTGFSRRPISQEALDLFNAVERMPGSPYVFRSAEHPTKPLSYNIVEPAFQRIVRQAGVTKCTLQTLRHWFATTTANSVNNPRVGMALTGHKSHAAYIGYVHADREQARALVDQLGALTTGLGKMGGNVAKMPKRRTK